MSGLFGGGRPKRDNSAQIQMMMQQQQQQQQQQQFQAQMEQQRMEAEKRQREAQTQAEAERQRLLEENTKTGGGFLGSPLSRRATFLDDGSGQGTQL